jgi:hypothetical protein
LNKLIEILLLVLVLPLSSSADSLQSVGDAIDYNGGICHDYNFAYYLKAAKGWRMDDQLASYLNSSAAFYPDSFTSSTSPVVVFTNVWFKDDSTISAKYIMDGYGQKFEDDYPGSYFHDQLPITTKGGDTAFVRSFANEKMNVYQMIAFNDLPGGVCAIILSSKNKNAFQAYTQGFREIATSYIFITDKFKIIQESDTTK